MNEKNINENGGGILEFLKFILITAIIVIPVRLWVAQPFLVSGASMESTFQNGNYLIVDEISYHLRAPKKNEVVIFRYPKDPSKFFIKRIIGLPGESVTENGKTTFLDNDEYFVMGDNRDASSDSRIWGPVKEDLIIGRAFIRLWPLNEMEINPGKQI
ncbi:MAG: signal peptidase I [Candidatus Terrybacteria bacterium CG10_big_fil_rev_8_21_14_0_10_41_10]|uniref:Signal peptidase I n=1 Tax=Candidatus Terrybacteria bacterium CG10_big_fil_rev_8_21_14_0_10_41_10 TaxID=1975026 RepID=A0A2M8LA29_9BACT|nr:MAG: signal peptidase I [Candidatus Terrybacteria bacterium CG10_big_fil_rev_8_21_14_0_10_41_10]